MCATTSLLKGLEAVEARGKVENLKLIVGGLKSFLALVVDVFVASCRSHPFHVLQPFRIFVSYVAEVAAAGAFSSRLWEFADCGS